MTGLQRRIEETKRWRDEALLAKRGAMTAFDQIHLRTARMFEELCRHAGKEELAERVRPAAHRRTRRRDGEEEDRAEKSVDGVPLDSGPPLFRLSRLLGKRTAF